MQLTLRAYSCCSFLLPPPLLFFGVSFDLAYYANVNCQLRLAITKCERARSTDPHSVPYSKLNLRARSNQVRNKSRLMPFIHFYLIWKKHTLTYIHNFAIIMNLWIIHQKIKVRVVVNISATRLEANLKDFRYRNLEIFTFECYIFLRVLEDLPLSFRTKQKLFRQPLNLLRRDQSPLTPEFSF